jgi:hypothetical protein
MMKMVSTVAAAMMLFLGLAVNAAEAQTCPIGYYYASDGQCYPDTAGYPDTAYSTPSYDYGAAALGAAVLGYGVYRYGGGYRGHHGGSGSYYHGGSGHHHRGW